MGCFKSTLLITKLQNEMQKFYFRIIPHNFTVSHIEDYLHTPLRTYYEFLSLIEHLGIHSNPEFQKTFWERSFVKFNKEKYGIDGILIIFMLLCKADPNTKLNYLKKYLNLNINHAKEQYKVLIMNMNDFKSIIYTYIKCITTIAFETYKAVYPDELDNMKLEEKVLDKCFSDEQMKSYVDHLLAPFEKKNYYVNAGEFLKTYMNILSDDMSIRSTIYQFYEKRMSDVGSKSLSEGTMHKIGSDSIKREEEQRDLIINDPN